jgi:two-component system, OmpR family, response regulator ResD
VHAERDLTILLLAEDSDLRALIRLMLEAPRRRIFDAANKTEALVVVGSTTVDLLVCDVVPPRLSGPRIVEELRRLKPSLSVLYISAWYDHPEFPDLGGEAILRKPFSREALNEAVNAVLS